MHTHPASFLGLICTFNHKSTSLLSGIIGVPKFGVKEAPNPKLDLPRLCAYSGEALVRHTKASRYWAGHTVSTRGDPRCSRVRLDTAPS